MATQIQTMPAPLMIPDESSGGFISQFGKLFLQPAAFFKHMPSGRQWLVAAILVMVIAGFTATTQTQSAASSTANTGSTNAVASTGSTTSSFDLSMLDATATTTTESTTAAATTTSSSSSTDSDTTLMNALIAATGVLVMWGGQTVFLSLVSMFKGYTPQIGRSFQIAVWASLPLALMLGLRYAHYANGGSGGSLGLSMLLDNWSGYDTLPDLAQRILAVFTSNLTLFWLWNLALLYLGARYALKGRFVAVALVMALWITAATVIPALVSDPVTTSAPLQSSTTTQTQQTTSGSGRTNSSSSTTTTTQTDTGGFVPGGGGGEPPSGGFPGGGAPPGG
ncbi:MAG: YIP1 family protein [Chloroflexi bacterium]|nr:YIP1 family protein [Chloroflexota bacterium]MCC6893234.1 YIP1 family protein [Anaerolineae bacterium]